LYECILLIIYFLKHNKSLKNKKIFAKPAVDIKICLLLRYSALFCGKCRSVTLLLSTPGPRKISSRLLWPLNARLLHYSCETRQILKEKFRAILRNFSRRGTLFLKAVSSNNTFSRDCNHYIPYFTKDFIDSQYHKGPLFLCPKGVPFFTHCRHLFSYPLSASPPCPLQFLSFYPQQDHLSLLTTGSSLSNNRESVSPYPLQVPLLNPQQDLSDPIQLPLFLPTAGSSLLTHKYLFSIHSRVIFSLNP
jgi:hypothetical protein